MKLVKRLLPFLLVLLLLTACGAKEETAESFSLPETSDAEPISAEAVVTDGRAPAEQYDLPEEGLVDGLQSWLESGSVGLLAETEDAAFYGLPYPPRPAALIRWGDSLAEFDWDFASYIVYLPRMAVLDLDGDGEEELVVLIYLGGGQGASAWQLHVLEKNPDGTMTDYAMPESLWHEQIPPLLEFVRTGERAFVILGRELVEIDQRQMPQMMPEENLEVTAGFMADFCFLPEENAVQFLGEVDLGPAANYVAGYTARIGLQDGVFTLSEFHLDCFS